MFVFILYGKSRRDVQNLAKDRKVKPKNTHANDHEVDMRKLARTTNINKTRKADLLDKKLNIKLLDINAALLLS